MSGYTVKIDGSEVKKNLDLTNQKVRRALSKMGNVIAQQMQTNAQTNAPWTDRTGAARSGLKGESKFTGDELDISIKHTVDYGVYLELCHAQRFAILQSARDSQVATLQKMLKSLLS